MQISKTTAGASVIFGILTVIGGSVLPANAQVEVPKAKGSSKDAPVPIYKVDPFWPKPLPNKWILQGIPVMVTDKDDHIWVVSRPRDANPDETGAANASAYRLLRSSSCGSGV